MTGNQKPEKNLNQRIEDLVLALERLEEMANKRFSFKAAFARGVVQGLGIVIGSSIVAGILYAVLIKFVSPEIIQKLMLENMLK